MARVRCRIVCRRCRGVGRRCVFVGSRAGRITGLVQGRIQRVAGQGGGDRQALVGRFADHLGLGVTGLDGASHAANAALATHARN